MNNYSSIKKKRRISRAAVKRRAQYNALRKSIGRVQYVPNALISASLDDMIAASRIVIARTEGQTSAVEIGTVHAQEIASRVGKTISKKQNFVTFDQLNKAIVEKNKREHAPTEETKILYKKLVSQND